MDAVEGTKQERALERSEEDQWFKNLSRDLHILMPREPSSPRSNLPTIFELYKFVDTLVEKATNLMHKDAARGHMTNATAWAIQCACIAMLVTGYEFPPCRLQYIKSATHPDYVSTGCCQKRSCSSPQTCKGNRFETFTAPEGGKRV